MRVKPTNPNAVIRDPHTLRPLPAEGADVPDTHFWRRRLAAGDVVRVVPGADALPVVRQAHAATAAVQPVGNEPIAPLTTRGK